MFWLAVASAVLLLLDVLVVPNPWKGLVAVLICVVSILTATLTFLRDRSQAKRDAVTGVLTPLVRSSPGDRITVQVGTNTFSVVGVEAGGGKVFRPLEMVRGLGLEGLDLVVELTAKGPSVSAQVRSWDGTVTAEIHNNEWAVPGSKLDRNYDRHGVEVLDPFGIPVLQLELVDANTVRIGGVICGERVLTVLGREAMTTIDRPKSVGDLTNELERAGVVRWFKYPSALHLGQRTDAGR
jgi:hypothetical protein